MKYTLFRRPANWLAASAVGAAVWVIVADPFPHQNVPESPENEISDVQQISYAQHLRPLVKQVLVRDVIAETRTLFEVAALYMALDRVPPRLDSIDLSIVEPGVSLEERSCLVVICFVKSRLEVSELNWQPTIARLRAELHRAKEQPGGLKLPDAASLEPTSALLEQARNRWHEFQREIEAAEGRRRARQQQTGR